MKYTSIHEFKLINLQHVLDTFLCSESFLLILINVIIYLFLVILMFGLFFLFDLKFLRTLNELKICGNFFFITTSIIILLLTLAGIPPLLGFMSKFFLFSFLLNSGNMFIFVLFMIVNFFALYFYIQNIRFLVVKNTFNFFYFKRFYVYLNIKLIFFLLFLLFLNLLSFFIFDDLIIFLVLLDSFFYFN